MLLLNEITPPYNAFQQALITFGDSFEIAMVWCPADEFVMGSMDNSKYENMVERPQHKVSLSEGFWFSCTLVTQEQWLYVTKKRVRLFDEGRNLPVEGITWEEGLLFCENLTQILHENNILKDNEMITLPTEAQWEYACRAGTTTEWYFGDDEADLSKHCWYMKNSDDRKHPIAEKTPNSLGIYDLYGNVAEWCLDDLHLYQPIDGYRIDPLYIQDNPVAKIVRGGAFTHLAKECRSSSRGSIGLHNPFNQATGLRIICVSKSPF